MLGRRAAEKLSMLYTAFLESCVRLKHKHNATTCQSLTCCWVQSFEKQGRKADDAVQYFLNPETDPFGRQLSVVSRCSMLNSPTQGCSGEVVECCMRCLLHAGL